MNTKEFQKGRDYERNLIKNQLNVFFKLKSLLVDLENEFRHHTVALRNPDTFLRDGRYRYCLQGGCTMLNRIYAQQFVKSYNRRKKEVESRLEDIQSELFDLTEGKLQ